MFGSALRAHLSERPLQKPALDRFRSDAAPIYHSGTMHTALYVLFLGLLLAANGSGALAQVPRQSACVECRNGVGFVSGVSQFDLSGTGTTTIVGIRFDRSIRRWLIAEGALSFINPREQSFERSTYAIPELQLQAQWAAPRFLRPYVGVGGGWLIGTEGQGRRGTASTAVGLRYVGQASPFGARAELRVRGVGQLFGSSAAEWTLGGTYRF